MQYKITSENRDNLTLLTEALRSGNYKQATGALQQSEAGFCCLGVAVKVYEEAKGKLSYESYRAYNPEVLDGAYLGHSFTKVRQFFGFPSSDPYIELTEKGVNLIEANLPKDHGIMPHVAEGRRLISLATLNDRGVPFALIADLIDQAEYFYSSIHKEKEDGTSE